MVLAGCVAETFSATLSVAGCADAVADAVLRHGAAHGGHDLGRPVLHVVQQSDLRADRFTQFRAARSVGVVGVTGQRRFVGRAADELRSRHVRLAVAQLDRPWCALCLGGDEHEWRLRNIGKLRSKVHGRHGGKDPGRAETGQEHSPPPASPLSTRCSRLDSLSVLRCQTSAQLLFAGLASQA